MCRRNRVLEAWLNSGPSVYCGQGDCMAVVNSWVTVCTLVHRGQTSGLWSGVHIITTVTLRGLQGMGNTPLTDSHRFFRGGNSDMKKFKVSRYRTRYPTTKLLNQRTSQVERQSDPRP